MSEKYLDLTGLGYFLEKLDDRYASSSDIPTTYLVSASVNGNTLTLTKQDNTTQTFTPTFTDTNYYPSRIFTGGMQISTSQGVSDTCALYVPYAVSDLVGGAVSTTEQYFAGTKGFNNGIKLKENGSYYATLQGDSSVSSNITLTLPSSEGTLALVSDIPEGDVDVTINGTATSTVLTLSNIIVGTTTYKNPTTFTGSAVTSGTPSGTTSVASSSHTHVVTGSVGVIGARTTSGSGTTARRTLTITGSFSNGSASATTSTAATVASSGHTHSVTASGSLS